MVLTVKVLSMYCKRSGGAGAIPRNLEFGNSYNPISTRGADYATFPSPRFKNLTSAALIMNKDQI